MHELSLCESVLQVLEQQAQVENYQTVTAVYLEIGALSGVDPEAMRFCFDSVVQGSLAEKARLEIIEIAGQAWCSACKANVLVEQLSCNDLCCLRARSHASNRSTHASTRSK